MDQLLEIRGRQVRAGGLLRDCHGNWVKGFTQKLGVNSSIEAEMWALRDSLELAVQCNISNLCIDMDASEAVELLKSDISQAHPLSSLICDCRWLMGRFQETRIHHVFRVP